MGLPLFKEYKNGYGIPGRMWVAHPSPATNDFDPMTRGAKDRGEGKRHKGTVPLFLGLCKPCGKGFHVGQFTHCPVCEAELLPRLVEVRLNAKKRR